jgi:anaerobic magnesium-protoporphyrin IX monomethyl ester cyclase
VTKVLLMCMPDIYPSWGPTHVLGPWLGGASIAGNCDGHEVYVGDLVLKRDNVRAGIDEAIRTTKPHVIGLSAMTFQYPTACKVASYVKANYPEIPIVLGGYHATALREEIALSEEGKSFDYIFAGEAEHTFNSFYA